MPETNTAILDAKRRARDYWDIDGLPALIAGATTVLLGFVWLDPGKDSGWDVSWILCFFLFFCFDSKETVKWLKDRLTYPRTGYVAPPEEDAPDSQCSPCTPVSIIKEPGDPVAPIVGKASRKAIGILNFPLLLVVWLFDDSGWIVCLACMASAFMFWHRNEDDPPWFEIAGSVIAGLVTLPVDNSHRFGVFLLVFGATGIFKGATLLTRYLRQHPAPQA
jgi:hypothetical protein